MFFVSSLYKRALNFGDAAMASVQRKFFVDTRQLAIALRDKQLSATDVETGFYYLECTEWELWDSNGVYAELFLEIFFYESNLANRWRWQVLKYARDARDDKRGAFRERGDIRRIGVLNRLIIKLVREEGFTAFIGINERTFHEALPALKYYGFDVV